MVGVSNVNREAKSLATFVVAGAWIPSETTTAYTWVLQQLQSFVYPINTHWRPAIIVSDRSQALMNGLDADFPDAIKLLCQLHIQRNFETNLKKLFVNDDSLVKAVGEIKAICACLHPEGLARRVEAFGKLAVENTRDKGQKAMEYFGRVMDLKKKWVGVYVHKIAHFGNCTTNRVEGAHATMKTILSNANGNLDKAFREIDRWFRGIEDALLYRKDREIYGQNTKCIGTQDAYRLDLLRGNISRFAYEKIKKELPAMPFVNYHEPCLCECRIIYKLPCCHLIPQDHSKLKFDLVDRCWFLDAQPHEENAPVDEAFDQDKERFNDAPSKAIARINCAMYAIEDKMTSGVTTYHELKNLATDLEGVWMAYNLNQETLQEMKAPPMPANKEGNSLKRSPIKAEFMEGCQEEDQNFEKERPRTLWPMISKESIPIAKVKDVYNPSGDGNCGFRCLAMNMLNDQDKYQTIKDEMLEHLNANHQQYIENQVFLAGDVARLYAILKHRGTCAGGPQLWFSSPDCAQIASDIFLRPVELHSNQQSMMFLPLTNFTYKTYQLIILQLFNGHFYMVTLKRHKRRFPTISPVYSAACTRMNINDQSQSFSDDS